MVFLPLSSKKREDENNRQILSKWNPGAHFIQEADEDEKKHILLISEVKSAHPPALC